MLVWTNWAGNVRAAAAAVARPTSTNEVVTSVAEARGRGLTVKAAGNGHSFAAIAATTGLRLDMGGMADPVRVDRDTRLVTVGGGMPVWRLNEFLAEHGLALPCLGDTDRQTIAGALATGTRGSAGRLGGLVTNVAAFELVTADGTVLRCDPDSNPEVFRAAVLGLGAFGIVTEVTLRCVDSFTLHTVERTDRLAGTLHHIDEDIAGNDHVLYRWYPYTERIRVTLRNAIPLDDRPLSAWRRWLGDEFLSNAVYGAGCRIGRRRPSLLPAISRAAVAVLPARGYTGPSYRVFPAHQRVRFVAMEYAVPRGALRDLLDGVRSIVDHLPGKVSFPVTVGFSPADDVWLSPCHGRDSAHVSVAQYAGMPYSDYFRRVEALATSLDGRPHWGKLHWRDADSLARVYPRFGDAVAVRDKLDPDRVFTNAYLERVLGA